MQLVKKGLSIILAVMMVISLITVMATATGAVTFEDTKLYFDVSSTGWELGSKDKVGFYVYGPEGELLPWGGKKLNGTDEGDGIWSYDPAAKGMIIEEGKQYAIIFTGAGNQTYDLLFDTTCYGHVAYCDDTVYENPVDSSKQTRAAFWKDLDASKYGPKLQISSIGTVVGTCPEEGKTPVTIFEDFLTNTLENAREYMVDTGNVTEQELIDNIGEGLGLTKDEVDTAIAETGVETVWSYEDSVLPGAEAPTQAPETQAAQTKTVTVGVDNSIQNKYFYAASASSAPFQLHYWGGADGEGDVNLTSINSTVKKIIPENNSEVTFYLYSAEIPADCTGFKARKGNNWFGEDADMTVDEVYLYVYFDEDKYFFESSGEEPTEPETQEPETQPETQAASKDGYYIVGNFTDWTVKDEYKMVPAPDTMWLEEPTEEGFMSVATDHVYEGLALTTSSQFKVVKVEGEKLIWNPDGMGNNYGENGEITADGTYDVYFYSDYSENYGRPGSFHGCIYVDGMPDEPATQEPTQAETRLPTNVWGHMYYVVGTMTKWDLKYGYLMQKDADGLYVLKGVDLTTADQFKVLYTEDYNNRVYFPDGMGNNYGVNGEITADGTYDVYFDPTCSHEDWFGGCIYVDGMPESTEPVDDKKPIKKLPFVDELTADVDTVTVYFQMPDGTNCFADEETGEYVPSWENENNLLGGINYPGVYWWQGSNTPGAWPGAKMTLVDGENNIFSANIPADEELANVIFNNAVDGGTDTSAEIYEAAFQTVDLNVQGAEPGDYDTLPEGSPDPDSFDGCIFVPDQGAIFPTSTLNKPLYPGRWYIYYGYGYGCYGMYSKDSDHFTTVWDMCCNPNHDHTVKPDDGKDTITVSADKTSAARGEEVTVTVTMSPMTEMNSFYYQVAVPKGMTFVEDSLEFDAEELRSFFGFNEEPEATLNWFTDKTTGTKRVKSLTFSGSRDSNTATESEHKIASFRLRVDDTAQEAGLMWVGIDYSTLTVSKWDGDDIITGKCKTKGVNIRVKESDPAYYAVGNFTGWAVDEAYRMTKNEFADTEEYMLTLDLDKDTYIKVVKVEGETQTWYPDGMGDPGLKINEDGNYTVYFRPNMDGGDDWHYRFIYAARNDAPASYMLGDADGDGQIDITDATYIQRYATKIYVPFTDEEMLRGDVDGDGETTTVDATYVQRVCVRIPVPYPVGEYV